MKNKIETKRIDELTPDPQNANLGTERGLRALDDSLASVGLGRSVVTDKHGRIIAGNKTVERATDRGFEDAIVVHTDGKQLVVVQRDDLDLSEGGKARELAYYDNRVAELDLTWNPEQLQADKEAGVQVVDKLWHPVELDRIRGFEDGDWSAEEHWVGLPEYERGENSSGLQMIIHFESEEDRQDFARRLDLKITEKTNNTWWPVKERRDL